MRRVRGAKIFVRRASDGKYLVLTGSVWPERPDRSQKPDLPGGVVEYDESFEEGAVRELREETGLATDPIRLVKIADKRLFIIKRGLIRLDLKLYMLDIDGLSDVAISWEHESYTWCDRHELSGLAIRQPYKSLIKRLIKKEAL